MRPARLFWGTLFVVLGILLLLNKFNVLSLDWYAVRKFFPVVLVLWGGARLARHRTVKGILLALNAFVIAILVFSLVGFAWPEPYVHGNNVEAYDQNMTEAYDAGITRASFSLKGAAGKYVVRDTTSHLIDASTHSASGQFSLDRRREGDAEDLRLGLQGTHTFWRPGRWENTALVKLNPNPVWHMDMDIGAAIVDVDLSLYKTESVAIDAGAASVNVKLGANLKEGRVRIHAGVSSIRLAVPETAGCEVRIHGGLSSKDFKGFQRINHRMYRTAQYEEAGQKIVVDIDAGLSRIHVSRY